VGKKKERHFLRKKQDAFGPKKFFLFKKRTGGLKRSNVPPGEDEVNQEGSALDVGLLENKGECGSV